MKDNQWEKVQDCENIDEKRQRDAAQGTVKEVFKIGHSQTPTRIKAFRLITRATRQQYRRVTLLKDVTPIILEAQ